MLTSSCTPSCQKKKKAGSKIDVTSLCMHMCFHISLQLWKKGGIFKIRACEKQCNYSVILKDGPGGTVLLT